MSYPQIVDYNEAVQHPTHAFFDPELRDGAVKENNLGLPLVLSGGFALTYSVNTVSRKFAVRCFHREIPSLEKKYEAIAATLKGLNSPYFVDFDFQQQGIKIRRDAYPIVRMDWVEGDPLGIWLDKNFDKPKALQKARDDFAALAVFLEREGIAHGDIQNGNVMLSADGVKLIDYDGMFVPHLAPGDGSETGHKHFQHPDRSASDYGPQMDRFSFIALDISLQALIQDAALYRKFREGGETIVFKANDFANPQSSEIFRILLKSKLKEQVRNFAAICDADISAVPTLEDFRAGRNIPSGKGAASPAQQAKAQPRNADYIAPFPVVDARDFAAASQRVGDRVELIGKIVEVKPGIGKWGKTPGRPYLSMNFGPSPGEVVKISILSEGLSELVEQPDSKLVGRWASVTGLIEPSQGGRGRNRAHLNITIEQGGQMAWLTEAEAQFRLASIGRPPRSRNRNIVKAVVETTEAPVEKAISANRNIVGRYTPNAVSASPVRQPPQRLPVDQPAFPSAGAPPAILPALHAPVRHMPPRVSNANAVARWMWISAGIMLCLMLIEPVLAH